MKRYAGLLLFVVLAAIVVLDSAGKARAPVPKQPPPAPPVLTRAVLAGQWAYDWGGLPDGWIVFAADGTYTAKHRPDGSALYCGTYALDGNTVTLYESCRDENDETGAARWVGVFRFDFEKTRPPELKGLSNGTADVSLTRPK